LHSCPFCHIRGSVRYPGEGQVLFDPFSASNLSQALASMKDVPKQVVLSPTSDPFPTVRDVRAEAVSVVTILLQRGIDVLIMTRGAIPRPLIPILAKYRDRARVEMGITTLNRRLSRLLEPGAASPVARLRSIARLTAAEVPTVVRFEPLIADLTDTRESVSILMDELANRGIQRVIAHYAFLHPAMIEPLKTALSEIGWDERLMESYEGGPRFAVGSLGMTKHLPVETRREGLARVTAWGAERGIVVETGVTQNPDFPRPFAAKAATAGAVAAATSVRGRPPRARAR
jgi:DNA repair photolyase